MILTVFTIENLRRVARKRGGECLANSLVSSRKKLRFRCSRGHEWDATPLSIISYGTWCPYCAAMRRHKLKRQVS